jgi:hypothetical protein
LTSTQLVRTCKVINLLILGIAYHFRKITSFCIIELKGGL